MKKNQFFPIANSRAEGELVKVEISEAMGRYGVRKSLGLKLNKPMQSIEMVEVRGRERASVAVAKGLSVDVDIPSTGMDRSYGVAVVIGNRDYEKAERVEYAIRDAEVVKDYLVEVLGYREGNVFLVENASLGDFQTFFGTRENYRGRLYNIIKSGKSDVFVYYSGHGAPGLKDRKGYFVPVECDPHYVQLGGYPLDLFYRNLSKLEAKSLTVVIDACFSGARVLKGVSPVVIEVEAPVVVGGKSVVMTSAQGDQVSCWFPEKKHSLFTYFFLQGLRGEADVDGDGVPYYARALKGIEQRPTIILGDPERVFLKLK